MRKIALVVLPALVLGIGPAFAQSASSPGPSGQGAPPHSGEASGHDAQAGRPATAQPPESTGGQKKSDIGEANRSMAEEAKKQKK